MALAWNSPGLAEEWGFRPFPRVSRHGFMTKQKRGRAEEQEGRRRQLSNFLRKWICLSEELKCQAWEGIFGLNDC